MIGFEVLLHRYADGRKSCNCREAYNADCNAVGCSTALN